MPAYETENMSIGIINQSMLNFGRIPIAQNIADAFFCYLIRRIING